MSEIPVVVLDPGHGGARGTHNRGSSWNRAEAPNGLLEKNVVFDVALRIKARLRDQARVELTRGEDTNPSLAERAEIARRLNASLFLSLHLNGSSDADVDGTDVYVAHDAGDATRAFGNSVWRHLQMATGTTRGGLGVRDFGTILTARHNPRTASCLAEIAYLTNPRQARALADEGYRNHIADALADAIRERVAPRAVASELAVADGSPFVNDALKICWEKCEQLRLAASNAGAPNVVAARRIQGETGATVDPNPYAHIGKNEIEAIVRAGFRSHAAPEELLALWAVHGNTRVITTPVVVPQATSAANARSIFRSKVYFEDFGARHFVVAPRVTSSGSKGFDDSDAAAPTHETRFAQRVAGLVTAGVLQEDIAGAINAELRVSQVDSRSAVTPTIRFYALSLLLVDALWAKRKGTGRTRSRKNAAEFEHYVESFRPIFAGALTLIKPGGARAVQAGVDQVEALQAPPMAPTFPAVNRVVTTALPGVAQFVRMPIIFDDIHGPFGAATVTTREVATEAAIRAEYAGFSFIAMPAPPGPAAGPPTDRYARVANADLVANAPFFRFVAGNIEAALDSIICYPADPGNAARLPPGTGRLPIAIIVHGAHDAANGTAIPTGPAVSTTLPNGRVVEITPARATYVPIDSHRGYCQTAPPIPAHIDRCATPPVPVGVVANGGTPYLQEALARIGIVSMSISTNGANQLRTGIPFRVAYIMQYLDQLRRLDAAAGGMFQNRLDFERVALIGHSRGGDAVVQAIEANAARPQLQPGDATAEGKRCNIRAVVTISPTDVSGVFSPAGAGPHPAVIPAGIRYLGLYGSHDGDVRGGGDGAHDVGASGFRTYDRASATERAMVFIHGANHNRFNRVWPDECNAVPPPATMTRARQEALASEYISAWLRYGIYDDPRQLGLFNGNTANAQGVPVSLMWSFGPRKEIETHQDTDAAHNTLAGNVTAPAYVTEVPMDAENPPDPVLGGFTLPTFPHVQRVGRANPVTGARAPLRELIPAAHANFNGYTHLTFRITKRYPIASVTTIGGAAFPNFTITLEDTATPPHRHTVSNTDILNANPRKVKPYFRVLDDSTVPLRNITKCNLETWRVPLSLFAASAPVVLLNSVGAIEFDFNAVGGQPIYIDSIALVNIT